VVQAIKRLFLRIKRKDIPSWINTGGASPSSQNFTWSENINEAQIALDPNLSKKYFVQVRNRITPKIFINNTVTTMKQKFIVIFR
jgi:hypothetical protein